MAAGWDDNYFTFKYNILVGFEVITPQTIFDFWILYLTCSFSYSAETEYSRMNSLPDTLLVVSVYFFLLTQQQTFVT